MLIVHNNIINRLYILGVIRTANAIETVRLLVNPTNLYLIQGSIVRSRANWYKLGEKSSKYFCNLENKNNVNKTIQKLEMEDGSEITDIKDILNEQKRFYTNLYENKSLENVDNTIHTYINIDSVNKLYRGRKNIFGGRNYLQRITSSIKEIKKQ
jgi:hypothetical protein